MSLIFADWTSKNYPSASFYFIHTRMWELLSGSILAYFEISRGYRSNHKILNLIRTICWLNLNLSFYFIFNNEMFHPSFFTVSPIVGVCLIIWYSNKDELITKITIGDKSCLLDRTNLIFSIFMALSDFCFFKNNRICSN